MDNEKTTAQVLKKFFIDLWEVFKNTFIRWNQSGPWRQSAILAYYAIFSLPALLLVVIALVGYFYGQEATSQQLSMRIAEWMGDESAEMIEKAIASVSDTGSTTLAVIIGVGLLLFGATTIFFHLQLSLNRIWGVIPKPKKALLKYVKDRLLSFGLILAVGFLLLVSMLLNSLLAILGDWINSQWAGAHKPLMLISNYGLSLGATVTLFGLMFKFLPDAIIRWRSVWVGALLTALLFALGQYALRIYFSNFEPASAYGAAGAMILILIWASYVSMILLFGAEFTRQWANKFGHGIRPKKNATLLNEIDEKYHPYAE